MRFIKLDKERRAYMPGYQDVCRCLGVTVWVADWIYWFLNAPARWWSQKTDARLTYQYEAGFAAGVRDALKNREYYLALPDDELENIIAPPPYEEQKKERQP